MSRIAYPMRFILLLGLLWALTGVALGDDAFTVANPLTGQTEAVWSAVLPGSSAEIFYSVLQGSGWSPSERITSNSLPDQEPHLAISSSGDRKAVWWKDGTVDAVFFAEKPASGGSWSTPSQVSDGQENARSPQVATSFGMALVAYEGVPASGYRKVIVAKEDSPDPWGRTLVATSSQSTSLSIRIHKESGHIWIDWIDSNNHLGWSEYVYGYWGAAQYESYNGPNDITPGRARIRSDVLGE